jgi:hypothetical protein
MRSSIIWMTSSLPKEIAEHLPTGYQPTQGVWFVFPAGQGQHEIDGVNSWLRAEDWYPSSLQHVVWFGDDGTGNFFGWDPKEGVALLWNPEDGAEPWKQGTVGKLWEFVLNGYVDAT